MEGDIFETRVSISSSAVVPVSFVQKTFRKKTSNKMIRRASSRFDKSSSCTMATSAVEFYMLRELPKTRLEGLVK